MITYADSYTHRNHTGKGFHPCCHACYVQWSKKKRMINLAPYPSDFAHVEEFERLFAEFMGTKYAVAVNSGTMADTIALAVLKAKHPKKKKVLVPALTFIAQVNAILYNNLEPVFYDFVPEVPEDTKDILALYPVHLLGRPTRLPETTLPIIEDTCEALGSRLDGKLLGTSGVMGTFSFYRSHTLSTGEGGAIVTNSKTVADLARRLRNHSSIGEHILQRFHFDHVGFNGKMTGEVAKQGIQGLLSLQENIEKRNANYLALGGVQREEEYIVPHGFPVYYTNERDEQIKRLNRKGIESRKLFSCIPIDEKPYQYLGHKKGDFPISEGFARTGLYVPVHQNLLQYEIKHIKDSI